MIKVKFTYIYIPQFSLARIFSFFNTSPRGCLCATLAHFDPESPVGNEYLFLSLLLGFPPILNGLSTLTQFAVGWIILFLFLFFVQIIEVLGVVHVFILCYRLLSFHYLSLCSRFLSRRHFDFLLLFFNVKRCFSAH